MGSDAKIEHRTRATVDGVVVHTLERNDVASDTVTIFLHGLGLDATDYIDYMENSCNRSVAVTLYGFDADTSLALEPLPLEAHAAYLTVLIRDLQNENPLRRLVLVGFSLGADLILKLADYWSEHASLRPDIWGAVLLDPNVNYSTMTLSQLLADAGDPLQDLKKIASIPSTLAAFRSITGYLTKITLKDFAHIRQMSRDVIEYWEPAGQYGLITERLLRLCEHASRVSVVVSRDYADHLVAIESGCTARDLTFRLIDDADHFDLLANSIIRDAVLEVSATGDSSSR